MNGFVRYTHDENGNYRNLKEWQELKFVNTSDCDVGYIHLLSDEYPISLLDLQNKIKKYNSYYPDDTFITDINFICHSLIVMMQFDMIKVVKIDD